MALSRQVIISDGTTKQYPITFADGYLSRDEVKVYEEFNDGTPNSDIPFIFINDNLIEISRVPVSGNKIVIERDVEANARKVNFIPQYIKSSDLNTMYKHLLYLIQAVLDGRFEESIIKDLDMGFNRIYNLGAPEQDNDAVRLIDVRSYTELAKDLNAQNTAHAAAAKQSELNAKQSEINAKASETSAANVINGFDTHAAEKQAEFDTNAAQKQAAVDASAAAAAQSEDNAEIWAEGTDEQVRALGGVHSAKGWTDEATRGQIQADWNQTDDTQKDYIKNKPDVVHKTGDETIDGVKTFLKRSTNITPNIDANVIPSSNIYNDFMVSMDKTVNNQLGYFGNTQETNGNILSRIGTSRRKGDGSYIHTEISVGTTTDGTIFTRTPTPALYSNSLDIVNTSWFNEKIQVVNTLPSSPDANVFYFVTNA